MIKFIIKSLVLSNIVFFLVYFLGNKRRKNKGIKISRDRIIIAYFLSVIVTMAAYYIADNFMFGPAIILSIALVLLIYFIVRRRNRIIK